MFLRSLADGLFLLECDRGGDEVLSSMAKRTMRDLFVLRCCGPFTTKGELKIMISCYFSEEVMPNVRSQLLLAHHHIFGGLVDEGKHRKRWGGRKRSKSEG